MNSAENENPVMIDLTRVSMNYPPDVQALSSITLQILRGEMLFLTGMSGAGKTTLLRLISGIEKPSKGYIEVDGHDLSKISRAQLQKLRRHTGVAYQDFKLLPERTVAQNIAVSMEVAYRSSIFIRKQTRDLLAQLHLEDKYHTRADKLSRGEQQRVAIARAVANKPNIILADEPTGNLDPETTRLVMDLFLRCNETGTTILIATHDKAIFDQPGNIIQLEDGRILDGEMPAKLDVLDDKQPAPLDVPAVEHS
jgi:cell division transport system ATP-binding protein